MLVVELHPGVRWARTALLDAEGYASHGVSDPEAALEYLQTHDPPSLLLLDLHFGPAACRDLIRELRAEPRLAAISVVLLHPGDGPLPNHRALGAVGALRKPVDPDLLLEMAHEYCD